MCVGLNLKVNKNAAILMVSFTLILRLIFSGFCAMPGTSNVSGNVNDFASEKCP